MFGKPGRYMSVAMGATAESKASTQSAEMVNGLDSVVVSEHRMERRRKSEGASRRFGGLNVTPF